MKTQKVTKAFTCPMHPEVKSKKPGKCPKCGMNLKEQKDDANHATHEMADHEKNIPAGSGIYTCPMHPQISKNEPGDCPRCGMRLEKHEQGHHHAGMEESFKKRFFIALPLTILVVALSPNIQKWFGFAIDIPNSEIISFLLGTIIVFWAGLPFYQMALGEIKTKAFAMMTLVSLAVLSGYTFSVAATFLFPGESLYWEISTLVLAFLFGHWMEMRAVRGATGALSELAKLIPKTAHLIKGKETYDIQTSELKVGDLILIKPGEKVPIDGIVQEGESSTNESMISGESRPVSKKKGSEVIGGTINNDGSLTVKVSKTGEQTAVSQMMELIRQAQETKPPVQKLADQAARFLTFIALIVGSATFAFWLFIFPQTQFPAVFAATLAISVVVIACPHALGLAIPTVTTIATSLAAKNGILIRDMKAAEISRKLSYVVFDKTGTLTEGQFGVAEIISSNKNFTQNQILSLASAVEYHSQHSIAQGITQSAKAKKLKVAKAANFKSFPGKGATAKVNAKEVTVGTSSLMQQLGISEKEIESIKFNNVGTVVYVAAQKELTGAILLTDIIRKESKAALKKLRDLKIKTAMLTGDQKDVAMSVGKELQIDSVFSEVLPKDKVEKIKELQKKGEIVAMVGDGVNDAPSLTQAHVGIAIGAGTGVAVESAQIILVKNDPRDVVKAISLSRKINSKMKQNLAWAAGYNVIAIPIAAGALFSQGILLRPEWAALLMSASSVIVVANALLLKKEVL